MSVNLLCNFVFVYFNENCPPLKIHFYLIFSINFLVTFDKLSNAIHTPYTPYISTQLFLKTSSQPSFLMSFTFPVEKYHLNSLIQMLFWVRTLFLFLSVGKLRWSVWVFSFCSWALSWELCIEDKRKLLYQKVSKIIRLFIFISLFKQQ